MINSVIIPPEDKYCWTQSWIKRAVCAVMPSLWLCKNPEILTRFRIFYEHWANPWAGIPLRSAACSRKQHGSGIGPHRIQEHVEQELWGVLRAYNLMALKEGKVLPEGGKREALEIHNGLEKGPVSCLTDWPFFRGGAITAVLSPSRQRSQRWSRTLRTAILPEQTHRRWSFRR